MYKIFVLGFVLLTTNIFTQEQPGVFVVTTRKILRTREYKNNLEALANGWSTQSAYGSNLAKVEYAIAKTIHLASEKLVVCPLPQSHFFEEIKDFLDNFHSREYFVFVDGYNNNYHDNVLKTTHIARQLGVPVAINFSWPSGTRSYAGDKDMAILSTFELEVLLHDLQKKTNAQKSHLVAFSMGTHLLMHTLSQMKPEKSFDECVLIAADISLQGFQEVLWQKIKSKVKRLTIYTCSHDRALQFARYWFYKEARLGEKGTKLNHPKLDIVDISLVENTWFGHSYCSTSYVLRDVAEVLRGVPANKRTWLRPMVKNKQKLIYQMYQ